MTFDALNQRCATIIRAGDFPSTIEKKKTAKPVVQQQIVEAHKAESVEEVVEEEVVVPDDAADMAGAFDDAFGSDSDEAPPVKAEFVHKTEDRYATDAAIEVIEDADGNKKQEEGKVQDGEHSGNTRRGRNNRGNYRGNDNGNDRGGRIYRNRGGNDEEGGDRGNYRGNRGNNQRRERRPNTGQKRPSDGEDDEGFNVVQDKNTENRGRRRPRGEYRGNRGGDRGDFQRGGEGRGYYRGRGRGGDGEGSGRGDRGRGGRGRGERPPRK